MCNESREPQWMGSFFWPLTCAMTTWHRMLELENPTGMEDAADSQLVGRTRTTQSHTKVPLSAAVSLIAGAPPGTPGTLLWLQGDVSSGQKERIS